MFLSVYTGAPGGIAFLLNKISLVVVKIPWEVQVELVHFLVSRERQLLGGHVLTAKAGHKHCGLEMFYWTKRARALAQGTGLVSRG